MMVPVKELLELRKQIKSKKPNFIRQDAHKKKRLGSKWRRPKGLHSKIRLNLRGRAKKVSKGYRSPKKVRYMHKSGLMPCVIRSFSDLKNIDAKKICLIISSSLGNKKRIAILKKAKELGLNILNIKNPDEFVKKVEDDILLRKKIKKEENKKGRESKKEEKLADKVVKEPKKDLEDKKEIEKKEKDKVLTKKDQ